MQLYESILTEHNSVKIRVLANSPEEAEEIRDAFIEDDDGEYCSEELDCNGTKEWFWTEFKPVTPSIYDECATIRRNEDGTFNAQYEGGLE